MKQALILIKNFEGFSAHVYKCPAGYDTIGYGSLVKNHPYIVKQVPITKAQAEALTLKDLVGYEQALTRLIKIKLKENQRAALIDFIYNLGAGAFQSSTLRLKLNRGDTYGASKEFLKWNKARVGGILKPLPGLTRRRIAEQTLFNL